jgi:2-aminoadipate transaminase
MALTPTPRFGWGREGHMDTPHIEYRFAALANASQRSEIRELLKRAQTPGLISLAGGIQATQSIDVDGLREATQAALAGAQLLGWQYGMTEGQPGLRQELLAHMATQGVAVQDEELLVTSGSQQGIDLLARAFLQPGDTVLVEDPAYLAATQAFALTGARVQPVACDAQGMRPDALMLALMKHQPKLVYMVSNLSNPTGATWSRERRLALLRWAVAHEVFVIEDDPYGQLWFDSPPPPSLLALAREVSGARARCGYMSSLSKIVSGGLRIGWLVLPAAVADVCVRLKQAMDLQTASFTQEVAAHYLASGRLALRLPAMRELYRERCHTLAHALHEQLGDALSFDMPTGGMFIWARLPEGQSGTALLTHALAQGLAYVPGAAFYAGQVDPRTLRLSYSNLAASDAPEAVHRLRRALEVCSEHETAA